MWVKIVVLILFLGIVASLGSALWSMMKDKGKGKGSVRALTLRVALSIIAFVVLLFAYAMGWIQPHGIIPMPN